MFGEPKTYLLLVGIDDTFIHTKDRRNRRKIEFFMGALAFFIDVDRDVCYINEAHVIDA